MDELIQNLVGWLREGSRLIGEGYMRLPVAGANPKYRERVYCYELYHQLRCQWPEDFLYTLCGEIDKRKHAYVRGDYLDNIKPDFLVHEPGYMHPDSNLLAIEVKPANAASEKIVADLQKLTALRKDLRNSRGERANYQHAIFWLYGGVPDEWKALTEQLKRSQFEGVDLTLIRCFVHERPGVSAAEVEW